jgi:hypothetical protein
MVYFRALCSSRAWAWTPRMLAPDEIRRGGRTSAPTISFRDLLAPGRLLPIRTRDRRDRRPGLEFGRDHQDRAPRHRYRARDAR